MPAINSYPGFNPQLATCKLLVIRLLLGFVNARTTVYSREIFIGYRFLEACGSFRRHVEVEPVLETPSHQPPKAGTVLFACKRFSRIATGQPTLPAASAPHRIRENAFQSAKKIATDQNLLLQKTLRTQGLTNKHKPGMISPARFPHIWQSAIGVLSFSQ
jgi:hypothetical protein